MRRVVLSLVLLGCRPQPGPTAAAGEGAQPPVAVTVAPPAQELASPPSDRDADGVPDASDQCPDEPEDHDEFEDGDGCVDRDNDNDKVLDAHEFIDGRWTNCDRMTSNGVELDCRNRPEDYDGDRDHDGCPDVLCLDNCSPKAIGRLAVDRRGKPVEGSAKVFGEVVAYMEAEPTHLIDVEVSVEKRTSGDREAWRLTRRVAERILDELVRLGVARERLEPVGRGNTPWGDANFAAKGRPNNLGVEFRLRIGECCAPLTLQAAGSAIEESGCR